MPDRYERRPSPGLFLLLVVAITTAGLLLRLPSFNDSLYADELSTYFIVTGHSLSRVIYLLQGHSVDLNAPLFFVLAWAAERLGNPAQSLRLISLLAGTAAIPLTYLLGLWTVGRRAALVGATLVALSPFLIFYSTEARAYGLMLLLALLSTLSLLRALNVDSIRWWVAYAACSCAAIYTQYAVVFLLVAQFAWVLWTHPKARRALIAANVAAAVAYLPWLPTLLKNTRSPGAKTIGFLEPFNLHAVRVDLGHWSIGHPYVVLTSLPGDPAVAMLAAGLAAAFLGAALRVRRAGRDRAWPRLSAGTVLVLVLALATPVGVALYSSIGNSVWEPRNLIASSPGLALAIGALVTSARGLLRVVAVGLVVGAFAIGGAKMLESSYQRPDYRAAASFIEKAGASGDPVFEIPFPTPGPLAPLGDVALAQADQSTHERHRVFRLEYPPLSALLRARPYAPLPTPSAQALARKAAKLARGRALFVVTPSSDRLLPVSPEPFIEALPPRFRRVETRRFPGLLSLDVYVFRDSETLHGREGAR